MVSKRIQLPKIYNQLDPQWKDKKFGTSATIGKYGCLICCVAMTAQYFGKQETPATIADKAHFHGNLWLWNELSRFYPDIVFKGINYTPKPLTTKQLDQIRERINKLYPVFLKIDQAPFQSGLQEHWVLAIDYDGDDFVVANPWGGNIHYLSTYGKKTQEIIYAFTWYEGKLIKDDNYYKGIDLTNKESIKVCIDTWHEVAVLGQYLKKEEFNRIIQDKEATINNLNQQINSLTAIINQLQGKIGPEPVIAERQLKEIAYQKENKTLKTKLEKKEPKLIQLIRNYLEKLLTY